MRVTHDADERLRRGFRVIRLIDGGAETPWPGALVCDADGVTSLAVDADILGDDWAGWEAVPEGHVLAPVDMLRRTGGHDVLLPVCTERVDDFVDRRLADGVALTAGEAVTVAVSLLRGVTELSTRRATVRGSWWLTDAGRPVFAADGGAATTERATADILHRLVRHVPDLEAVLVAVADIVGDTRDRTRDLVRAEEELFALASPAALATTTFPTRSARAPSSTASSPSGGLADAEPPRPLAWSLARHLDADWADLVSRSTTAVWRALRRPSSTGRGKPWIVAACLAGIVMTGGLLWPAGTDAPATAETAPNMPPDVTSVAAEPPAAATPPAPTETPADDPPAEAVTTDDLAAVTDALLAGRAGCEGDGECLDAFTEDPHAPFASGVVDLPGTERTLTLLDEFGGVAVLRADAPDKPSQLVVIVRIDGRWLLRDVHDVAEQ
jgi:hypothetical protein